MADFTDVSVLLVEDEPDLADLFRVYLTPEYTVRVAHDGTEALNTINETIDVILLDRRMPGMSGHDVLDTIRSKGYDTRVAMLTAVEPDEDIIEMPFDDYRKKPISKEELRTLVEGLCHRATFDEQSQEFFALASKKAALEAAAKTDTDTYQTVTEKLDALDGDLTDTLDHLAAEDAFAEIGEDG